jgi:hypothetical protein
MSHKYEVYPLRKRALTHISAFHPTTLLEYEALGASPPWFIELLAPTVTSGFPEMVVLARELSIDWILPVSFHRVCEFAEERRILRGDMGLEDKVRVMAACRMLEATAMTEVLDFLWPDGQSGSCPNKRCSKSRFECRRTVEKKRVRLSDVAPRMPLEIWKVGDWDRLDVCNVCLSSMKVAHQEAKQSIWDSLPTMFGLPEWSELEKMKAEAFK